MRCLQTPESMSLHHALKPFTDRSGEDIDKLTRNKVGRRDARTDGYQRILRHREALQMILWRDPSFLKTPQERFGRRLFRSVDTAELYRMEFLLALGLVMPYDLTRVDLRGCQLRTFSRCKLTWRTVTGHLFPS